MSLEIVLVPLAIAGIGAWRAQRSQNPTGDGREVQAVQITSRLRDGRLVAQALTDLGLAVDAVDEDHLTAREGARVVGFSRDADGLWHGLFDEAWTENQAIDLLNRLDAAYGLQVQQEVLARIRERAPDANMVVESETVDDDASVTLMLTVGQGP